MKAGKPQYARFHVQFGAEGMPDLTDAPDDTLIPVRFSMERTVEVLEGAPDPNAWNDRHQGMFLFLLILHEYQQRLPDPAQPLTKAMIEDAMAQVRRADEILDKGPLALQRAKRLASEAQYERAGALWRQFLAEEAQAEERERMAALGRKLALHLQESRAEALKTHREAAQQRYEEWKRIGRPIREQHPHMSNAQLAQTIARRTGKPESWHAIRKALPELGLQRRRQE